MTGRHSSRHPADRPWVAKVDPAIPAGRRAPRPARLPRFMTSVPLVLMAVVSVVFMVAPGATAAVGSERWRPAPGQTYGSGWALMDGITEATFQPCQTVRWYFDRTNEPGDRVRMIDDVRGGLSLLEGPSGLRFVEASDRAQADVLFNWADLKGRGADVAGIGGPDGPGKASVSFSSNVESTLDVWAGRGVIHADNYPSEGWETDNEGRQTLVIHEVMHGMGFGHVNDESSIMHPSSGNGTTFNAGDLAGLNTLYLQNPCPKGQVCVATTLASQCDMGATWSYAMCWEDTQTARLQEKRKKKWVNVKAVQVVPNSSSCSPSAPNLVEFEFTTTTPGRTPYRVVVQGPRGTKPAYDNVTVTRRL